MKVTHIIHTIKDRYIRSRRYILAATKEGEDLFVCGFLVEEASDGELTILKEVVMQRVEAFAKAHTTKYPIVLNIDGEDVISKKTVYEEGYLQKLIFRASLDDFYFYEQRVGNDLYISFCRKERIQELLDVFTINKDYVTHITIGPFVMAPLASYLDGDTAYTNRYALEFDTNELVGFSPNTHQISEIYEIDNESFNSKNISALGAFFDSKINQAVVQETFTILKENQNEFLFKKIFDKGIWIALSLIILLLGVGHFVKVSKTQELFSRQSEITILQQQREQHTALLQDKNSKEAILMNSGFNRKQLFTNYISSLTNKAPENISLLSLEVQPLARKIKPNELLAFDVGVILLKGTTSNDAALDQWIVQINTLGQVQKVEILNMEQSRKLKNVFEMRIELN